MKKTLIIAVLVLTAGAVFAGGINEYKGKKYLCSMYGGNFATAYANKDDLSDYDLSAVIDTNKNLYFISLATVVTADMVLKRGHIQSGDKFKISDTHPNTLGIYNGPNKFLNIRGDLINGACWVVGYATQGKGIVLTEIIVNDAEFKILESSLKEASQ
jgi:hypothetical protein